MKKTSDFDYAKFLTTERLNYSRLQTQDVIKRLKETNFKDLELLHRIENEDVLMKVKLRTYKRCKIQLFVSLIVLIIGLLLNSVNQLFFMIIIVSIYFFISSFLGMRTNKISKLEEQYSTNKSTKF